MSRKRFGDMNCSIAQSLEVLGDWWTLLIVREAFFGTTRFKDFQANLGIAKNVLSSRLEHLVEHEVFSLKPVEEAGKRLEYCLTPKGKDLLTVVMALREWSDRWVYGEGNEPVIFRNAKTGQPTDRLRIRDVTGALVEPRNLMAEAGPGADRATRGLFRALRSSEPA